MSSAELPIDSNASGQVGAFDQSPFPLQRAFRFAIRAWLIGFGALAAYAAFDMLAAILWR